MEEISILLLYHFCCYGIEKMTINNINTSTPQHQSIKPLGVSMYWLILYVLNYIFSKEKKLANRGFG